MRTVSLRQAKIRLSRLIDEAARGEPFIIARAGKPLVKVISLDTAFDRPVRRLGFMQGQFTVPDDFDQMGDGRIEQLFAGTPE